MADKTDTRLRALAADGNIDAEDALFAAQAALADGTISALEAQILRAGLAAWGRQFEPAAKRWLEDALAGRVAPLPNRPLLAQVPRGEQGEVYQARRDVVSLQDALVRVGVPTTVDGDFGPGTAAAVSAFQKSVRMPETGVLDTATLARLNEALEARGQSPIDLTPRARIRPDTVVALKHGGNTADNLKIEEALNRLSRHFGLSELSCTADGRYDVATEAAVRAFQRRAYLPETGIVDRVTLRSLDTALTTVGLAATGVVPPAEDAGFDGAVELHFYPHPDEHKLVVKRAGAVLDVYGMVGGHAEGRADPNNPAVPYSPTPAGTYEIVELSVQVSQVWPYSYVPFGAPLREVGGEIQFRDERGQWQWATGPSSAFAGRKPPAPDKSAYKDAAGRLLPTWTKSDFGHLRGRLKDVATGRFQSHMIHPSGFNEGTETYFSDTSALENARTAETVLKHSHGCEHIHPRDLDELLAKGYLAPGTRFIVHGYDERSGLGAVS